MFHLGILQLQIRAHLWLITRALVQVDFEHTFGPRILDDEKQKNYSVSKCETLDLYKSDIVVCTEYALHHNSRTQDFLSPDTMR